MPAEPQRFRPKTFPPPEFPPRRSAVFARTPPALFPSLLGMIGLGLALRRGLDALALPGGLAEVFLGAVVLVYCFAAFAYLAKVFRRPATVMEDLRILPGRSGLATSTIGGMLVAAVLVPYAPGLAQVVLAVAMVMHGVLAVSLILVLRALPPAGRDINPTLHLSFVGFIVGGVAAPGLGMPWLVVVLLIVTGPIALTIWALSLIQLVKRIPPAPLRPFLAIHLAPAALTCTLAASIGYTAYAQAAAAIGLVILLALVVKVRWVLEAGFTPLWGALTFPLAAFANALIAMNGVWLAPGIVVLIVCIGAIPAIAWNVLKNWPGGRLAAVTNAAEA
jgi:tellurite resistance protein